MLSRPEALHEVSVSSPMPLRREAGGGEAVSFAKPGLLDDRRMVPSSILLMLTDS